MAVQINDIENNIDDVSILQQKMEILVALQYTTAVMPVVWEWLLWSESS